MAPTMPSTLLRYFIESSPHPYKSYISITIFIIINIITKPFFKIKKWRIIIINLPKVTYALISKVIIQSRQSRSRLYAF